MATISINSKRISYANVFSKEADHYTGEINMFDIHISMLVDKSQLVDARILQLYKLFRAGEYYIPLYKTKDYSRINIDSDDTSLEFREAFDETVGSVADITAQVKSRSIDVGTIKAYGSTAIQKLNGLKTMILANQEKISALFAGLIYEEGCSTFADHLGILYNSCAFEYELRPIKLVDLVNKEIYDIEEMMILIDTIDNNMQRYIDTFCF